MLVIGVGNVYRRDDGAGIMAARALRAQAPAGIVVREESGEGASLIEAWQDASEVVVVDATRSGSAAGTIHCLEASRQILPARFFHYSTHAFSVAEAVELARALGRLPRRLLVYGIEGKDFESGEGLSPEVGMAVAQVVERIIIRNRRRRTSRCPPRPSFVR